MSTTTSIDLTLSTARGHKSTVNMAPVNPTGFDIKEYKRAGLGNEWRAKDPWKRAEAWRYTGPFTRWNRFKGAFPGFGIGLGAFLIYVALEKTILRSDDHGHGHGEEHH